MSLFRKTLFSLTFFFPFVSHAQLRVGHTPKDFADLVGMLISIINALIPLVIAVAVIVFFWGIVRYIASVDEDAKEKGRELAVWGSLAFFVMISVFGIINILALTFGVTLR